LREIADNYAVDTANSHSRDLNMPSNPPATSTSTRRRRFLEAVLESATDYAIIAMDLDGLVTMWNRGAELILGWSESEICGQPASVFFTLEDRQRGVPQAEMRTALEQGFGSDERWHLKKDGTCFWASGEMMPLKDDAAVVFGFLKILRDRTEYRLAQERQALLNQELAHRVKNTLAVVQAISAQTFRGDGAFSEARKSFNERLIALGRAHDILMHGSWAAASLRALVEGIAVARGDGQGEQIKVSGPDLNVGPRAALSFALVLHEMATNAVKYGALSTGTGSVTISWGLVGPPEEARLTFRWSEQGGPAVKEPGRKGFGSRLIESSFAKQPGDVVRLSYLESGVVLTLEFKLKALQGTDNFHTN
jgi:PAS domain S-box-containing protein